ncbi:MAG: PilT/PilU family type 4a pilus ATPase, partial [Bryobacterales bacterium]|nr:PilT/PilU family type 4a pilus ATPase [Bryobacterales bacterium]
MQHDYDNELNRIVDSLNRAVGGGPREKPEAASTASANPGSANPGSMDALLSQAAKEHASDLLLVAGAPIAIRVMGRIAYLGSPALSVTQVRNLVLPLLDERQQQELHKNRTLDFRFARPNIGRCRANLHYQRGSIAASIRVLPSEVPTIESLNLPPSLARYAEPRQGLVLVTGPTGCGKSSTLAALINLINQKRRDHIVTIEDPIEFEHPNRNSIVEQIEVGYDAPDFASGLRSILRQSPDVILVGEIRDNETMSTVLTAAETGHLVFSTLHTNDTAQSLSRILDSFPSANQAQIRQQLSLSLLAVIAQQLVPSPDGRTRYPAVEVMVATDAIRNLIRKGEDHQLRSQLTMGRAHGMITMEQSLAELVRVGRIQRDTALAHCFRSDDLR